MLPGPGHLPQGDPVHSGAVLRQARRRLPFPKARSQSDHRRAVAAAPLDSKGGSSAEGGGGSAGCVLPGGGQ
jgi:hypothetical protein